MAKGVNFNREENMLHIKKSVFLFLSYAITLVAAQQITGCSALYNGEKLFFAEGCSQCHSFKGRGGSLAPDLSAVTNIRSDSWIKSYIHNPQGINPMARMPAFKNLSGAKRGAIIAFLKK